MIKVKTIKANQYKITDEERELTILQSYDSTIISIDRSNLIVTVYPNYNYSKTTSRYRNQFLTDEGFREIASTGALNEAIDSGVAVISETPFKVVKVSTKY